jgi:VCBS repeat-containing protein
VSISGYGSGVPINLTPVGSTLYFQTGDYPYQLWRTDGRPGDAVPVDHGVNLFSTGDWTSRTGPVGFIQAGTWVYFFSDNGPDGQGVHTYTLWRNDSAAGPTSLSQSVVTVSADPGGSGPYNLVTVKHGLHDDVYFGTYVPADTAWELWKVPDADTGPAAPVAARFLYDGIDSNGPGGMVGAGSKLYFGADAPGTTVVMWESDGTFAGTGMVQNGGNPVSPSTLEQVAVGSDLYVITTDGHLWRLSGQTATDLATLGWSDPNNIAYPSDNLNNDGINLFHMTAAGDSLYFTTKDLSGPGPGSYDLWKWTGSTATQPDWVWHAPTSPSGRPSGTAPYQPSEIVAVGPDVYLTDWASIRGESRLWKRDGTTGETTLLKWFSGYDYGSSPYNVAFGLTAAGSAVYLQGSDGMLWRSEAESTRSTGIFLGPPIYSWNDSGSTLESPLVAIGSTLYFASGFSTFAHVGPFDLWRLNSPPAANADAYTADSNGSLTVAAAAGVLANDTDPDAADAGHLTAAVVSGPSHGTLTLNADGSFTYTPAAGYTGPDSFTYQASDGIDPSNVAAVSLNVQDLFTSGGLQSGLDSLPNGGTVTVQATTVQQAHDVIAAANALDPVTTPASTVVVDLGSQTVQDTIINVPPQVTVTFVNGTFIPGSPDLVVNSGVVVVRNSLFLAPADYPTILVTGGTLVLRNDTVNESTGYTQAAVRVTGGTADLGTASDPGGNTLVVNGPGAFLDAAPGAFSEAGDTHVIIIADQAITPAWPTRALGASSVTLGLTSTSGLPVSYTVSGPATLAGNVLTITGLGAVTVTAHQAGNDYYNAAPVISTTYAVAAASLCGVLFKDFNEDGFQDFGELGSAGVSVQLTGTDFNGASVSSSVPTGSSGYYQFPNLLPGTYAVSVPGSLTVTKVTVGLNGAAPVVVGTGHSAGGLALAEGTAQNVVNFGLAPAAGDALHRGQTAGIDFWQNRNGQALLKSLNGGGAAGSATQLGSWLADTFAHLFGSAGANLAGQTNAQVAAYFQLLFATRGDKLEAQVMATALSVYVTNSTLAGGTYGTAYGFTVAAGGGAGVATFNVGSDGAAVDHANGTAMTLMDILLAADRLATHASTAAGFALYAGDQATRGLADDLFGRINDTGGL